MNLKKWILLLIVICFSSLIGEESTFISNQIKKIPPSDKEKIEQLFSYLIFEEGFAFTLFGSKPMSVFTLNKNRNVIDRGFEYYPVFKNGEFLWKTWNKYKFLFKINCFSLFSQYTDIGFEIYLINNEVFLNTVKKNIELFRPVFGVHKTSEEILKDVISSDDLFGKALKRNETLYGILLGFGRENALTFEMCYSHPSRFILAKSPKRYDLDWRISFFCPLDLPRFTPFSEEESVNLIKKYDEERRKILYEYSKGNFLEITFSKLSET